MHYILLALGLFVLDQWTKWLVMANMSQGESIPLIESIFYLTYVRNPGAAFGMLPYKTAFFITVTLFVLVAIVVYFMRVPAGKRLLKTGLVLQLGGATGNLLDRVRFGAVVDFFDFRVWPVFNVADIGIVVGVGILFIELLRGDSPEGKVGPAEKGSI